MPADLSDQKRALRADLRERRRLRTAPERDDAAAGHTRRLIEVVEVLGARSVSAYLSTPSEPNTRPFLNWARERGIRTLLPISREDGLLDWTTGDGETERSSIIGLPEAVGELLGPIAVDGVDVILVPAAAVDSTGMRLGWDAATSIRPSAAWKNVPRSSR